MNNDLKQFYYEFDEHEYYALIAVNIEEDGLNVKPHKKAAELYFEFVGGESVEKILDEAEPNQRTKEYAFMKFAYASDFKNEHVEKLINEFEGTQNGVLLIDSSLV